MSLNQKAEARALTYSMYGNAAMAAMALAFAVLTGSEAILLDGAYSLVALIMAFIALRTSQLVLLPGSRRFHFGYALFEPATNTARSLLILAILVFAFGSSIVALFTGGHRMDPGVALAYSIVMAVMCLVMAWIQSRQARRIESALLKLDATNWIIDSIFSAAVGVGFGLALLLSYIEPAWLPYADPLIVIVLVVIMAPIPARHLVSNFSQMLLKAPNEQVQAKAHAALDAVLADQGVSDRWVGMLHAGRVRYVMVYLLLDEQAREQTVLATEKLRCKVEAALRDALPGQPELEADVIFTGDPARFEHITDPFSKKTSKPDA